MGWMWIKYTAVVVALMFCACGSSQTPGATAGVPEGYPKDLPIYPGATVTRMQTGSTQHLIELMLASPDSAAKIVEFYKQRLASNGWKITNTMTSEQVSALTAVKDKRQAILQVLYRNGKSTINQVVSDKL